MCRVNVIITINPEKRKKRNFNFNRAKRIKNEAGTNKQRICTLYNMSFTVLDKNSRNVHKNIIMFLKADNYRHTFLI